MDLYLAGTDVQVRLLLQDDAGNGLDVSSIQYQVLDPVGTPLVALGPLAGFTAGDPEALVTVPAALNTLAAGEPRAARIVELQCLLASGNTVTLRQMYAIEGTQPLLVGINSFQTYDQAVFNAESVPNLTGWDAATRSQRLAALTDARLHICQLNFDVGDRFGQDSLYFVPEGVTETNAIRRTFSFGGNLSDLTPAQFQRLPASLLAALKLAQVVEADFILGGDPIHAKRVAGVQIDDIGDSKQMFRTGKPLQLPVSRRALGYLAGFVSFNRRIARG